MIYVLKVYHSKTDGRKYPSKLSSTGMGLLTSNYLESRSKVKVTFPSYSLHGFLGLTLKEGRGQSHTSRGKSPQVMQHQVPCTSSQKKKITHPLRDPAWQLSTPSTWDTDRWPTIYAFFGETVSTVKARVNVKDDCMHPFNRNLTPSTKSLT